MVRREYQQPLATDAAYWKLRIDEKKEPHPLKFPIFSTKKKTLPKKRSKTATPPCATPPYVLVARGPATTARILPKLSIVHSTNSIPSAKGTCKAVDSGQGPSQPSSSSPPDPDTSSKEAGTGAPSSMLYSMLAPSSSSGKAKEPTAELLSKYTCPY
ncbi:hypothetical protein BKA70DRAFT_1576006 [Coprinopsis sp. MPI-PUGE-AT-0042]|nr:hypothetical protein BKA70DRAFT_1576006 [Coprinopsis sp. MPI-PUGE-AT-0042]